jgi:hypothetical protein
LMPISDGLSILVHPALIFWRIPLVQGDRTIGSLVTEPEPSFAAKRS